MANQEKVTKLWNAHEVGSVNTFSWSGGFEVFKSTEVEVYLDDVKLTYTGSAINDSASPRQYSVDIAAKTIHIGGADLTAGTVIIQANTDVATARATYQGGSSVASGDLNANQTQILRKLSENQLSDATSFTTGNTAPTNPGDGDVWYDSVSGRIFVYYVDVDSGQWVEASPPFDTEGEAKAGTITYTHPGTGSSTRTIQTIFEDYVSVVDFGAIPFDASKGDINLTAFKNAMTESKTVYIPSGVFYISDTLPIQQAGQRLLGAQGHPSGGCGIYPNFTDKDTIENEKSDVEIGDFWIYVRGSSGIGYHQYGGAWLYMHDMTFYNPDASNGTGIVLNDRNKLGTFVPGSYNHRFNRLNMARGNPLTTGIKTDATSGGINATNITDCHIKSDKCIDWQTGGGGLISGNLLQSGTGTHSVPVGYGVYQTSPSSLQMVGNYMESFAYDYFNGSLIATAPSTMVAHHTDNSSGIFGFQSSTSLTLPFCQLQDGIHQQTIFENPVSVTSNGQAISTNQACVRVAGNGSHRTNCTLSVDNAREGQLLWFRGDSWAVQIIESSTADFGPFGSGDGMIFGTEGATIAMSGVVRPTYKSALFTFRSNKWHCLEATPHRAILGNYERVEVSSNNVEVPTNASVINVFGNGANRTGCWLQSPKIDGQTLTVMGTSWGVVLDKQDGSAVQKAVYSGGASGVDFSNTSSDCMTMNLVAAGGLWYEISRTNTP